MTWNDGSPILGRRAPEAALGEGDVDLVLVDEALGLEKIRQLVEKIRFPFGGRAPGNQDRAGCRR